MSSTPPPLKWITLGGEILATILGYTLVGWILGKAIDSAAPVVIGSISGIAYALYSFVRKTSSKSP